LAISTLNFLDPSNFASKPREEKASFLKGLLRVLPGFSDRLKRRKILPSLLDEVGFAPATGSRVSQVLTRRFRRQQMKDVYLLPFLLPDVFEICKTLTNDEFAEVLPRVQPLFDLKDSAQTMLMLIESIPMFAQKTSPEVFRKSE
jgi:SCY1-like protein 2